MKRALLGKLAVFKIAMSQNYMNLYKVCYTIITKIHRNRNEELTIQEVAVMQKILEQGLVDD